MLDNLIREYGGREICAEVYIDKAGWLRGLGASYMDEVLQVCDKGVKRYPAYKRINELRNIRESVLQPYLNVSTQESVYPGGFVGVECGLSESERFYTESLPYESLRSALDGYRNQQGFLSKHARKLSAIHFELKPSDSKSGKEGRTVERFATYGFEMPRTGRIGRIYTAELYLMPQRPVLQSTFSSLPASRC